VIASPLLVSRVGLANKSMRGALSKIGAMTQIVSIYDLHLFEYQDPLIIILTEKAYCVYIMTNSRKNVLYTGYTSDIGRRVQEHKDGVVGGFTQKYKCHILVYYEVTDDANAAREREKQIKGGSRSRKIELVDNINSEWRDLSGDF
jgi:putative endonuclease